MTSRVAKLRSVAVDGDLRSAQREAKANPNDRAAQSRLAIAERRNGRVIDVDGPELLAHILVTTWVSTRIWAAIRLDFHNVAILKPGLLWELLGFRAWMSRAFGQVRVARIDLKERHSLNEKLEFEQRMLEWVKADRPETYATRSVQPNEVLGGIQRLYGTMQFPMVKTTRVKEVWSIEHVRLACGMDPIEPPPIELLRVESKPKRVGRCNRCPTQGYERQSGQILCYDCNKVQK